jgi:hypothetical protein
MLSIRPGPVAGAVTLERLAVRAVRGDGSGVCVSTAGVGQVGGAPVPRGLPRALLTALAVAVTLAGCGPGGAGGAGGAGPSAILAHWESFPVDAKPRTLVLTGPVVLDPRGSLGDFKEVYQNGRVELAAALPASPPTAGGYPVLPAKAALERFHQVYPRQTFKGAGTTPRLRIVKVTLGQASFETDRGSRRLPAWRLGFDRLQAPAWILAVDPKALWTAKPTSAIDMDFRATPSVDGRSLTLTFIGGPDEPTPCGIAYTADAVESATVVVIVLTERPQRKARGEVACTAEGHLRTVTARLASPLGGRVLLTPYGVPMQVPGS